jgi:hypothetical protein
MGVYLATQSVHQFPRDFARERDSKFPDELIAKILINQDAYTLGSALLTSKRFHRIAARVIQDRARELPQAAFGAKQWKEVMGVDVGAEPPLPPDIYAMLADRCPFANNGKRVEETHILMLIPQTINGLPLNLQTFGELFKSKFPDVGNETGYRFVWHPILQNCLNQERSRWVLMTRDVLHSSRAKSYFKQKTLVENLGQKKYEIPSALEAVVCILMEFARGRGQPGGQLRLLGNDPWTYTRCQDFVMGYRVIVSGFAPASLPGSLPGGLVVQGEDGYNIARFGVAALRKLV